MRRLIAVLGLTIGSVLVALPVLPQAHAATRSAAPSRATSLSIMVGGLAKQIYLPSELAQQLGYFKKEGLNVTLIDEPSGQSSEDATIAGQVQAGSGAYQHTIELQTLGKGLETVVQLGIAPGEAEMVASKEASSIHSFKDLKGKNLGVTELGSGTHALSKYLLLKAGVSDTAVHFIPVGAADTFIAAIQKGTIDAGMTTEPTISRLLASGDAKVLVDLRTPAKTRKALGSDFPFISVFMASSYVSSHKSVVQHVANAYVRTLHWIHTHSAAQIAAKMPADYYAGDKALYITALKAQLSMFSPTGLMPKGGPQIVLKLERATNTQVGQNAVNLSKTYTNSFVAKADKMLGIK
jgi:NitT/TauT family transport system substrate-binding protein